MLREFKAFLAKEGLKVFDCETVVGIPAMRMATAIDVVCVDNLANPREVCVLELKTGYLTERTKARTVGASKYMSGLAGQRILNSVHNHHQLQLWFGVEALERTYPGIHVSRSYVIYCNNGHRYKAYQRASWWDKDASRKDLLLQLNGATIGARA